MEPNEAQQKTLNSLPRKTYTVLPPTETPKEKSSLDQVVDDLQVQAKVEKAYGGSTTLFARALKELLDLKRKLALAEAGKPHYNCPLCGHQWTVGDYSPVNDHGDCYTCAREQYGH